MLASIIGEKRMFRVV